MVVVCSQILPTSNSWRSGWNDLESPSVVWMESQSLAAPTPNLLRQEKDCLLGISGLRYPGRLSIFAGMGQNEPQPALTRNTLLWCSQGRKCKRSLYTFFKEMWYWWLPFWQQEHLVQCSGLTMRISWGFCSPAVSVEYEMKVLSEEQFDRGLLLRALGRPRGPWVLWTPKINVPFVPEIFSCWYIRLKKYCYCCD